MTPAKIELGQGGTYIVVSGNDRITCPDLQTLAIVLRDHGWTREQVATQIQAFRGGLLDTDIPKPIIF